MVFALLREGSLTRGKTAPASNMTKVVLAIAGLIVLPGCGPMESAAVSVSYEVQLMSGELRFPAMTRKGVESAFGRFAEQYGYKCRPDFKYPQDTTCRGPKDLHLEFQPSLNKSEFLATFSWVGSSDRTHEEFVRLVTEFKTYMGTVVGDRNVQLVERN